MTAPSPGGAGVVARAQVRHDTREGAGVHPQQQPRRGAPLTATARLPQEPHGADKAVREATRLVQQCGALRRAPRSSACG